MIQAAKDLVEQYKAEGKEIPTIPSQKEEEGAGTSGTAISDADARLKEEMAALNKSEEGDAPAEGESGAEENSVEAAADSNEESAEAEDAGSAEEASASEDAGAAVAASQDANSEVETEKQPT